MKKLLYIYNPAAGRKTAKANLSDVMEVFARQGYEITVHPTQGRGDAVSTVIQLGGSHDRVVCCGGDGTLNETVQGLLALPKDRRPVLGYIPAGTTNDFSRTLELPRTLPELAETAGEGVPRLIDVGQAEGRPFTYVAAFGLFTDVSYSTPSRTKICWATLPTCWRGWASWPISPATTWLCPRTTAGRWRATSSTAWWATPYRWAGW